MSSGIIFDIRRFSIHDGPGIRTTVFFKGCPLSCWWCHNPESRSAESEVCTRVNLLDEMAFTVNETIGIRMDVQEVMEIIRRDRIFYEKSGGGVTFSGGEPTLQKDFLIDLIDQCIAEGITTAVDTSGYVPSDHFEKILDKANIFLYDLKIMNPQDHVKYTGVNNEMILNNLKRLIDHKKQIFIRIPVIPGITDTAENLDAVCNFLESSRDRITEVDLLPYHHLGKSKYGRLEMEDKMKGTPEETAENINRIRVEFQRKGFLTRTGG